MIAEYLELRHRPYLALQRVELAKTEWSVTVRLPRPELAIERIVLPSEPYADTEYDFAIDIKWGGGYARGYIEFGNSNSPAAIVITLPDYKWSQEIAPGRSASLDVIWSGPPRTITIKGKITFKSWTGAERATFKGYVAVGYVPPWYPPRPGPLR